LIICENIISEKTAYDTERERDDAVGNNLGWFNTYYY